MSSARRPARDAARSKRSRTATSFAAVVLISSSIARILARGPTLPRCRAGVPCGAASRTLNLRPMPPRGKLIALEGIDGTGKHTQMDLLARTLEARGLSVLRIAFPRYESTFGRLAGRYLNGDFGPLGAVDPHLSALVYAGDRFEAKGEIESALAAGRIVLADRYIASNLAHQGEHVLPEKRDEFFAWLRHVEYRIYG